MNDNEPTAPPRPHCFHCGQPLRAGEPHWAGDRQGRPWHYGCAEKAGLTYSWFHVRPRGIEATEPPCRAEARLPV